jgi:hypothetical protein
MVDLYNFILMIRNDQNPTRYIMTELFLYAT